MNMLTRLWCAVAGPAKAFFNRSRYHARIEAATKRLKFRSLSAESFEWCRDQHSLLR
jgi:hypothetical protein